MSEQTETNEPLPLGWCWVSLGQLAADSSIGLDRGMQYQRTAPPGSPYIKMNNVTMDGRVLFADLVFVETTEEERERYSLVEGDLLFNTRNSTELVGKVGIIQKAPTQSVYNNNLMRIRFDGAALPAFVCYQMCAGGFRSRMEKVKKATTSVAAVYSKDLFPLQLALPPLAEQERITDALDELFSDLDAGVAALERVRTKLRHYRAAVLKAAVEGALTADRRKQRPATEPASALLTRILAERRRRWEQDQLRKFAAADKQPPQHWKAKYKQPVAPVTTNLPPLPDGWGRASFDQIGETQGGLQRSPSRKPTKNHYPYLRVANVHRGSLDLRELHRFELTDDELERLRLQPGDLLIVEGNGSRTEIGRCALWRGDVADCVHQNHIIRIRPLAGVLPKYANLFLNSPDGQNAIQWVASSTSGLYTLSVGKIQQLPLALPPTAEQEAIVEIVEDQLSVIEHIEADVAAKLKSAQALRQSILRHAFTGQLVPQDPHDEPASELLKRIAADRDQRTRQATASKTDSRKRSTRRKKP